MADYVIYTDTACDIDPQMLDAQGVKYVSMYFSFIGEDKLYANNDMDITEFYRRMRAGGMAKSAAANPQDYKAAFEEALAQGKDVLYIGLSGALSSSFGSAVAAAKELQAQYPARTIITVDTLSASAGEGMLVNLAVEKKNAGASLEETAAYIEEIKKRRPRQPDGSLRRETDEHQAHPPRDGGWCAHQHRQGARQQGGAAVLPG